MTAWSTRDVPLFAAALIRASHDPLAVLARAHYQRDGRGAVVVTVRGLPPDTTIEFRELRIGYRPLAEYRRITASMTGQGRTMADGVIRGIETYDPSTDMIVLVVVGPQFLTVNFTIPLDAPVLLDQAEGVH